MNDETKEILDLLNFNRDTISNGICRVEDFMSREQIIKLLDYITNLQQENENFRKLKESYQLKKEFYESRIDKAIDYIEKEYQDNIIITDYADNPITPQELYEELLEILKGDSND